VKKTITLLRRLKMAAVVALALSLLPAAAVFGADPTPFPGTRHLLSVTKWRTRKSASITGLALK
jgi:hypothetical protein